jgi:hypothetical protein
LNPTLRHVSIGVQLVGWRLVLPILRRTVSLDRLVGLLAKPRARGRSAGLEQYAVRVARRLWQESEAPCLERSLALHRHLGSAGAKPELVLGIDEAHRGHAWVTVDGLALLEQEPPELRYTVLVRYDVSGTRSGDAVTASAAG